MRVGLRLNGLAIGVDPSSGPGFPVYADREDVGAWEEGELTSRGDGTFDFRFLACNRQLSVTPDDGLESRLAGAIGAWETLYATNQPDGSALVYRVDGVAVPVVLTIEARS